MSIIRFLKFSILLFIFATEIFSAKLLVVPDQYATIQDALNRSSKYDTVYVKNGKYRESITLFIGVVLLGENPDKTIIRGNGHDPVIKAANNSVIKNFTITNGGMGILSENTNMIIQNNIIRNNQKTGIQCILSLPHIQNNIIANNNWSGVYCELVSYGSGTAIEHNIFSNNGYTGVTLSRKSGILVQNNVFIQNRQFGVNVSENSRKSRIIYNNFYNNRRDYNNFAIIDATNISVNPKFPSINWNSFELIASYRSPTKSSGKNGAPIGVVRINSLNKLFEDIDTDNIPDGEDACPNIPEDIDNYEDYDGCPDKDNDNDGIYDTVDKCPNLAEDFDGFEDRDGCPDNDNDNDGILDHSDRCPNEPEIINNFNDEDGCPDKAPNTTN